MLILSKSRGGYFVLFRAFSSRYARGSLLRCVLRVSSSSDQWPRVGARRAASSCQYFTGTKRGQREYKGVPFEVNERGTSGSHNSLRVGVVGRVGGRSTVRRLHVLPPFAHLQGTQALFYLLLLDAIYTLQLHRYLQSTYQQIQSRVSKVGERRVAYITVTT